MVRGRAAPQRGSFAQAVGLEEWPTWALLSATYGVWAAATFGGGPLWLMMPVLAVAMAQHSSLQHEVLHGHPTKWTWVNEALVALPIGLFIPYGRFRDTHLQHHFDPNLTDPYDDPESNYFYPEDWHKLPRPLAWVLEANTTLAGRMVFGPALGLWFFYRDDLLLMFRMRDPRVALAWALHLPMVALILWLLPAGMLGAYLIAAYAGLSLIRVRSFLEHQAHEHVQARTVIVEDKGFWALLFLNNNLHLVHHAHPQLPWFKLPSVYRARRDRYLRQNRGYLYRNYADVFRRHLFRSKDAPAHPIWHREGRQNPLPPRAQLRGKSGSA